MYQLQNGSIPTLETLTYEGSLSVSLSNIPAEEIELISGYRDGNYTEFSIGEIDDPKDVYLDIATSQLKWQSGQAPDINTNYTVWYRYTSTSSDLRAFAPGSILRLVVEAMGYELRYAYEVMEQIYYSGLIDYAEGLSLDYLTAIVLGKNEVYPDGTTTPRLQPTKSEGKVTFYGSEGSSVGQDVVVRTNEETPRYYVMTNPQDQTIPSGSNSITIDFISVETGSIQNVSAGLISVIDNPSAVSGITGVTNLQNFGGGTDLETDPDLRERAKNAFQTQGKGSLGAIKYAVMAIPGIANCFTNDYSTIKSIEKGLVSVMVVGETIPIDQTTPLWNDPTERDGVVQVINDTKGAGILPIISQPYIVNISLNALMRTNGNFESIKSSVISEITEYINGLNCGNDVLYSKIHQSIKNILNIEDFVINWLRYTNASNLGTGGSGEFDPTPDFAKEWWDNTDGVFQINTPDDNASLDNDDKIAQIFNPGTNGEWLSGVTISRTLGTPYGSWKIEIWSVDGSDTPVEKLSGTEAIEISSTEWEDENATVNLKFSAPIHLNHDNNYALVIYRTDSEVDTDSTIDIVNDVATRLIKVWAKDGVGAWEDTTYSGDNIVCNFHFSGTYKTAQSFTFNTKVVKYERRTCDTEASGTSWTVDPTSETRLPLKTTGFLGVFKATDLTGDGIKESPDLFDWENYGARSGSSIASDGTITFDDEAPDGGHTFNQDDELVVSYEYFPDLEVFKAVKLWLRSVDLYGNPFDGQVILRIETDDTDKPSGDLVCFNEVGYCLAYDDSATAEQKWDDETKDINDEDVGDIVLPITDDDYLYIGDDDQFKSIQLLFSDYATGGTITVEYYNGSSWVEFEKLIDGTSNLQSDGIISFFPPLDWEENTVKDIEAYWVRIGYSSITGTPTISVGYLSFAEKILNATELGLSTTFNKIFFEFDKAIKIKDDNITDRYWIVLQAVGQKNGRIVLKTDDSGGNYGGRSRQYNGSDWTTKNSEYIKLVTEESVEVSSSPTFEVENQASMENDAFLIDVMDQEDNDKNNGAQSLYYTPDSSGSFDTTEITLPSSFDGNLFATYSYDAMSSSVHTDWMFSIVMEKLVNPIGTSRLADLNIPIESEKQLLEKAIADKIEIEEMTD